MGRRKRFGVHDIDVLCIGTHHKTGTKWLRRALARISKRCGIPLHYRPSDNDTWANRIKSKPALVFSGSSRFPKRLRMDRSCMIIRMIRDPRDILISGMRYHLVANDPFEDFLYAPREELDGKSYQDHLRSLKTYEERLMFEMENKHFETVQEILSRNLEAANYVQWRYEDLIVDSSCEQFRAALNRLSITDDQRNRAVKVFHRNSLFGGATTRLKSEDKHVVSGAPRQWERHLPRTVAERYAERFGDTLIELGYEEDRSWLTKLAPALPAMAS